MFSFVFDLFAVLLAQSVHDAQPETKRVVIDDGAMPVRFGHAHWLNFHAMPLCVFHDCRRRVKAHRLIVQKTRVKFRSAMHFQISAAIGENGETDRMRFRKSVQRKRRDRVNDLIDLIGGDAFAFHGCA